MTDEENKQRAQENLNALLNEVKMRQQAGLANAVPTVGSLQPESFTLKNQQPRSNS